MCVCVCVIITVWPHMQDDEEAEDHTEQDSSKREPPVLKVNQHVHV